MTYTWIYTWNPSNCRSPLHAASNLLTQWKAKYRNPSSLSSLPTILSLKPTITAIHHCRWTGHRWGTTAIVVKSKEERWGSRPAVTWERPGPVHAFAAHTRGPLRATQRQEEDNRGVNARALTCQSPRPSVFTWPTEQNRSDLCKRRGSHYVSCASLN